MMTRNTKRVFRPMIKEGSNKPDGVGYVQTGYDKIMNRLIIAAMLSLGVICLWAFRYQVSIHDRGVIIRYDRWTHRASFATPKTTEWRPIPKNKDADDFNPET